jgi:hypothetical protein
MATKYVLVLLDVTGEHKPIAKLTSDTPFLSVHTGDRFDDVGWQRLDGKPSASATDPRRYIVHSVKHLVYNQDSDLVVEFCLNLRPHDGPSSPIWGDD